MQQFKQLFLANIRQPVGARQKGLLKRYSLDTLLAVGGTIAITLVLYGLHLYPTIRNISLVYLLVVLLLGSTRGLFSAVVASLVAFLSFDFFLVPPLYMFTIGKEEEWL